MAVDPNVLQNVKLYVGAIRIADMINAMTLGAMVDEKDTTNAASGTFKESIASLKAADCTFSGFWRTPDDVRDPDAYLYSKLGTPLLPVSAQQGGVAFVLASTSTKHCFGAPIGELNKLDLVFKPQSPLARGKTIEEYVGAADHNSDPVNLGAVASGKKLFLAVHVFGLSGVAAPTLDLIVESDADDTFASPASRFVVPQFTAAGFYYATLAGAITDTRYRVAANTGGTSPTTDYAVLLGIA